jgi:hypothetical protein
MKRIFTSTILISLIGIFSLAAQERIYVPELSLPVNGAVNQMPDVVLDWNAVTGGNTGIIKYDIQLDTDPGFPSPVNFQTELLSAYKTSNLIFGETYYWRVRAKDGDDITDWSETWSFRVIMRVVQNRPIESTNQKTEVVLTWYEITGINEYEYQLDTSFYWSIVNSGATANLFSLAVVDDTHAWAVGAGGLVLFYDGTSWSEQESTLSTDLYDVYFTDVNNGWAVGKSGKIIYYNGTEWAAQSSSVTGDLNGIHMLDASNGWAVGKAGVILHYNGSAWSSQFTAAKDMTKVFAFDATHVWAVGKVGTIAFYNGSSWVEQESNTSRDLFDVGFGSANHGWAVGKTGELVEFKDGVWTRLIHTLANNKDLLGIHFVSPDNAWTVGKSGLVLQYDGIEWFNQSGGTNTNLNAVCLNGNAGFVAGEGGLLISYNDDAFSSPLATIHEADGSLITATVKDLLFGSKYFWRMRTRHDAATSPWSGARSFNTVATVTLDEPENNATNLDLMVTFSWDKLSNEVTYEIQLDISSSFNSPITLQTSDIEAVASGLSFGHTYYWRVRAMHAFDNSDWSETRTFNTVNSVTLLSPANNATDQKLSPLLTWKKIQGIVHYEVMVDENSNFAEPLAHDFLPAEENSYIVPLVLEKDAMYYWKVRAINGLDTSNWSNAWAFRTQPPVGIDEPGLAGMLNVFPNPVENTFFIELKTKSALDLNVSVTDLLGKTVIRQNIQLSQGKKSIPVDVSTLGNGIYILRIANDNQIYTKKLIIKR